MRTVAETKVFRRYAAEIWSDEELMEFISWIAKNPTAGDLYLEAAVVAKCAGRRKARGNVAAHG